MESPSHCQGKHSQTEASARTCALYSVRMPVPRSIRPSSASRFEFRIGFPVETVPRVIIMSSTFRSQRAFMTASERTLFGIHWAERATRAFKSCSFECEWDKLHTREEEDGVHPGSPNSSALGQELCIHSSARSRWGAGGTEVVNAGLVYKLASGLFQTSIRT